MIRTAIRQQIDILTEEGNEQKVQELQELVGAVNGNMGFVFCLTDDGLEAARAAIDEFVVPAAAKANSIAPKNVSIPAGPTGLEPSQTSFFQALNIPTKIVKGAIEITNDFQICTTGEKVSLSAQALLAKMNIRPFEYGMKVRSVYQDGSVFDAAVLDISDDVLIGKFMNGVSNMAAFSRELGIPTAAGLPHAIGNAFRNVASLVADIDFTFKEVEEVKQFFKDPSAFAAANCGGGGGGGGGGAAAPAAAAAAKAPEPEEEDE